MPRRKCSARPPTPALPENTTLIVKMPDFIKWSYELHPDGFKASITIMHDKPITLSNILAWPDFVHGLYLGWEAYAEVRNNADLSRVIDKFIRDCIFEGKYGPYQTKKEDEE